MKDAIDRVKKRCNEALETMRESPQFVVLTTIALIAMRLFYVQELIILFLIFAAVLACVVALLVAGVLLNHAVRIAFGWTKEQRSAFVGRLRRSREHTDKLPVGRPGALEKEVEARIRQEKPTSFFLQSYLIRSERMTTSRIVKESDDDFEWMKSERAMAKFNSLSRF